MSRPILKTKLCDMLGIEYPIMLAAMAPNMSDPPLVAAVSEAGGIGVLACTDKTPDEIHDMAAETRKLTDKPFGMDVGIPSRVETLSFNFKEAVAMAALPEEYVKLRDEFLADHGIPYADD